MIDKSIGERVKEKRLGYKPRLTQQDMAAQLQIRGCDIDNSMISKIEKGERGISAPELKVIAEILKTTPNWLLDFTEK